MGRCTVAIIQSGPWSKKFPHPWFWDQRDQSFELQSGFLAHKRQYNPSISYLQIQRQIPAGMTHCMSVLRVVGWFLPRKLGIPEENFEELIALPQYTHFGWDGTLLLNIPCLRIFQWSYMHPFQKYEFFSTATYNFQVQIQQTVLTSTKLYIFLKWSIKLSLW